MITEEQRSQKEADMQDIKAVEHREGEVTVAQDKQLNNQDNQEDQSKSQRREPTLTLERSLTSQRTCSGGAGRPDRTCQGDRGGRPTNHE